MRFVSLLLLLSTLPMARALLPLACMCTVNEEVLQDDYSPFVGCGAHRYDSRWCNIMDPENCRGANFDCDVCDDPGDCEHLYHKEQCEVKGGVHLWDRFAKIYHPGVYWRFCSGDRCRPLTNAPYQVSSMEEISIGFVESMDAEDWPDCCKLCDKYDGCVAWKWVFPAAPALEAAPTLCSIYRLKPGVHASTVLGDLTGYESSGVRAFNYARSGNELTVWGVGGFDDAPTSCLTRGTGLCHEDIYVFVAFFVIFALLSLVSACWCTRPKLRFRAFVQSGVVAMGFSEGLHSWEETYRWTDKNGTHTGRRQRYKSQISFQFRGQDGYGATFTDRDKKDVCGGVCYDKWMAKQIYKRGRRPIQVLVDPKDPHQFVTGGPWMPEIVVHLIGLGFWLGACLTALRSTEHGYVVRDQAAPDLSKRDEQLAVPGWGSWEKAYLEGFEGSEWASFYDADGRRSTWTAFLVIGIAFWSAFLLADLLILKGSFDLRRRLASSPKVVQAEVVGAQMLS